MARPTGNYSAQTQNEYAGVFVQGVRGLAPLPSFGERLFEVR